MSHIKYNNRVQSQKTLFTSARQKYGALHKIHGRNFGATWARVLIGPDLSLPGGTTNNPPNISGKGWDKAWGGTGYPSVTFVGQSKDVNVTWIAGHMVNGEWGGTGSDWKNLTPLSSTANSNHKTVEGYMKKFCAYSLSFDNKAWRTHWVGVDYLVQRSKGPWASTASKNNLYSYAPEFIKVSWRAVAIAKPNLAPNKVQSYLDNMGTTVNTLATLPFTAPSRPNAISGTCVPASGNTAGGTVYAGPGGFPAAQANSFDGQIEVHQA